MFWGKDADKKTIMIKMCLFVALGALLSMLLMFPARGIMNAVSRLDYISQRLDDYPRMRAVDLQESEARENWWRKEVLEQRAKQAAYIYTVDQKDSDEAEKLAYIAQVLEADSVKIVSGADVPAGKDAAGDASQASDAGKDAAGEAPGKDSVYTVWEELDEERIIVLEFSVDEVTAQTVEEGESYMRSQGRGDVNLPRR